MQLVVVEELVQTARPRIVLFVLLLHDSDVVNEFAQESLHALDCGRELHYLLAGLAHLLLRDLSMDLEVPMEAFKRADGVEVFGL